MQKVTETGEPGEDFSYLSGWTRAVWVTSVMKTVSAEIMQREWENKKGAERLNWTAKEIQGDLIWLSIALRRWERTGKKATAVAKQRARAKVTDDVVLGLPSRSCSSRSEAVSRWGPCSASPRLRLPWPLWGWRPRGAVPWQRVLQPPGFQPQTFPGAGNFSVWHRWSVFF